MLFLFNYGVLKVKKFVQYNKDAVEEAIKKDPTIKPKEAKLIHVLLKGHSTDAKKESK